MRSRAILILALSSMLLTACPFFRPKSVDCGGVRSKIESTEKQLAPFSTTDPGAATSEQLGAWAAALSAAQKEFPAYDELVHDDVKRAAKQYKGALDALHAAVSERASGKGPADGSAVQRARTALETSRKQFDESCPASSGP